MVEPVGQCAVVVQGEALVESMEGHVLEGVVVQRQLCEKSEENLSDCFSLS